jgi:rod shape-determining protein MreD
MIDKIKKLITIFDIPSGAVLGIHTLVMITLSIFAYFQHRVIESSLIAVYGVVLGAFAVHKTTTATTQIIQTSGQDAGNTPKPE